MPEGFCRGVYVRATIFADVDPDAVIAQEEIFGPVLAVIPYRDDDEAVAIANNSRYVRRRRPPVRDRPRSTCWREHARPHASPEEM
jgi:hypothetical protein